MKQSIEEKMNTLLEEFKGAVATLETRKDFKSAEQVCLSSRALAGQFGQKVAWHHEEMDLPTFVGSFLPVYEQAIASLRQAIPLIKEPIVGKYLESVQGWKERISQMESIEKFHAALDARI